jgi:hypothetical protein
LLIPELLEVELVLEPPVLAFADLFPPWLDFEDDLVAEADRDPPLFEADVPDFLVVELFAVAICGFSNTVEFERDLSLGISRIEIYVPLLLNVCILPYSD